MDLVPVKKKAYLSKTIITNAIMAIVAFIPALRDKVNVEVLAQIMVVVNIGLRFITKDKIELY